MSIDRHLHGTATAVSELWTDENDTRARLAALRERVSSATPDEEQQPQTPPSPPHASPNRPNQSNSAAGRSERPLSEVITFLTVAEVAHIMGVSKISVYRLVHSGHLPAIRVGRSFRVVEQAVHEYLRGSYLGANADGS